MSGKVSIKNTLDNNQNCIVSSSLSVAVNYLQPKQSM